MSSRYRYTDCLRGSYYGVSQEFVQSLAFICRLPTSTGNVKLEFKLSHFERVQQPINIVRTNYWYKFHVTVGNNTSFIRFLSKNI